jgi:hypothetical protein
MVEIGGENGGFTNSAFFSPQMAILMEKSIGR